MIDTPRVRKQTRHYNSFEDDELMEFSELDSDSEERPCRTRRLSERNRHYLRAECFRVEKNLLIFGSVSPPLTFLSYTFNSLSIVPCCKNDCALCKCSLYLKLYLSKHSY